MKQYCSDILLVEKLQKGDVESFDILYDKYAGSLYSFGLKYLKSKEETEELIQDVFFKLWENHKGLNKELCFKSYLFTIAYNQICKYFRKRSLNQKFVEETIYVNSQFSTTSEEKLDYQSVLARVSQIIEKLPPRQRLIFEMSRFEGKSAKEISEEIGLSPGSVDNAISKSLKFIRSSINYENLAVILIFYGIS